MKIYQEFARRFHPKRRKIVLCMTLITVISAIFTAISPNGLIRDFLFAGEVTAMVGLVFFFADMIANNSGKEDSDGYRLLVILACLCWMATVAAVVIVVLLGLAMLF